MNEYSNSVFDPIQSVKDAYNYLCDKYNEWFVYPDVKDKLEHNIDYYNKALEILRNSGKYVDGETRKHILRLEGYDPDFIQLYINELKKEEERRLETHRRNVAEQHKYENISIEDLARKIIDGKLGYGHTRRNAVESRGYDYRKVQDKVNELLRAPQEETTTKETEKPSTQAPTTILSDYTIEDAARDILKNKYGYGADRKKAIEALGLNYSDVQKKVNELMKPYTIKQELDKHNDADMSLDKDIVEFSQLKDIIDANKKMSSTYFDFGDDDFSVDIKRIERPKPENITKDSINKLKEQEKSYKKQIREQDKKRKQEKKQEEQQKKLRSKYEQKQRDLAVLKQRLGITD